MLLFLRLYIRNNMAFEDDMFIMTGGGLGRGSGKTYTTNNKSNVDKYKKDNKGKDLNRGWTYQEIWDEVLHSGNVLPKTLTSEHRVVFVDADAVVFRTSAAVETRSVKTVVEGIEVEFPTRTLLKEYCVDMDVEYEDLELEDCHVNEHISGCLSTLKKTVKNIYEELNATHVIFFLGGTGNFRLDLPLPTQYKAARKEMRRPDYLKDCRDFLNKHYCTFIVNKIEADDVVVGMTGYIINNTDAYCTAYQLDKDFRGSLVKNRYYHITNKQIEELTGGVGKLELTKNDVKGEGLHWLLYQLNQGDVADGFSPKMFFSKRYGSKSYYKDFKDYTNEKDLLTAWIAKWKELLPELVNFTTWDGQEVEHDWLSLANLYFKAPYMLTHPQDYTSFSSLLVRYNVNFLGGDND